MGRRTFLAAIGLLYAQGSYRPFTVGVSTILPTGVWSRSQPPFPQGGHAALSYGAYGAKEYYDKTGRFGWFIFFQAVTWDIDRQALIESIISQPLPDRRLAYSYRLPFSNVGGVGLIYRYASQEGWYISFPLDIRITYINYPQWVITLPALPTYLLLIESNSFLGFAMTPTFWKRVERGKQVFWGVGLSYPVVRGKPAYYVIQRISENGEMVTQRHAYYLPPQYLELRMIVAFAP
ncbi:MAG: hypothetical protein ABDH66_04575 [Bacteroidia bacterium]